MSWRDVLQLSERLTARDRDRYVGKPLLILLENYVLDTIHELPPDRSQMAARMTARIFPNNQTRGTWKQIIREELHLENVLDDDLRRLWATSQERFQKVGKRPDGVAFARAVVDDNFANLIG